jgi:hypothetical protein
MHKKASKAKISLDINLFENVIQIYNDTYKL